MNQLRSLLTVLAAVLPLISAQAQTADESLFRSLKLRAIGPAVMGGRIDDLALTQYRETVDPNSPAIVLLAPSGSPHPFYAEFGWVGAAGASVKVPGPDTLWRQLGSGTLGVGRPITLIYDNGEGLEFRRTISVDDKYLFTIRDEVVNKSASAVTLYPYALISRHGTPKIEGWAMNDRANSVAVSTAAKSGENPWCSATP